MFLKKIILVLGIVFCCQSIHAQKVSQATNTIYQPQNLTDSALLTLVQQQTFTYFWDFAHPVSGLARERSNESFNYGHEVVTTGGTGFGIMALVVATERKFITRDTAAKFLLKM